MMDWLVSNSPALIGLCAAVVVACINNLFIGHKFKKLTSNHFHGLGGYLRVINAVLLRSHLIEPKELEELNQKADEIGSLQPFR